MFFFLEWIKKELMYFNYHERTFIFLSPLPIFRFVYLFFIYVDLYLFFQNSFTYTGNVSKLFPDNGHQH